MNFRTSVVHADGDGGRLGLAHVARHGRGQPDARRQESDGTARRRTRPLSPRNEDPLRDARSSTRASPRAAPASTAFR